MGKKKDTPRPANRKRGRPVPAPEADTGAPDTSRFVVYVHGICHPYPRSWDSGFAAMHPSPPRIPTDNRQEVLWSDAVGATPAAAGLHTVAGLTMRLQATQATLDPSRAAL